MEAIPIFLAIAIIIIAVAFLVSWAFRKTIGRDKKLQDINAHHDDGTGIGTGIGIDKEHGDY